MSSLVSMKNINTMNNMNTMKPAMKTKFTNFNHPTYKKDLEVVSKMMPIASYQSISTMAGSSEDGSTAAMSIPMMNDDVSMFDRAKTLDIQARDAIVKAYGNGEEYKLAKLRALEEKRLEKLNALERKTLKNDPINAAVDHWAHFDYDSNDDLHVSSDIHSRVFGNLIKPDFTQESIAKNDFWAHFDYDCGEMSAEDYNQKSQRIFAA